MIGADGANSQVRKLGGFGSWGWGYGQEAVVCTVKVTPRDTVKRPEGDTLLIYFLTSFVHLSLSPKMLSILSYFANFGCHFRCATIIIGTCHSVMPNWWCQIQPLSLPYILAFRDCLAAIPGNWRTASPPTPLGRLQVTWMVYCVSIVSTDSHECDSFIGRRNVAVQVCY